MLLIIHTFIVLVVESKPVSSVTDTRCNTPLYAVRYAVFGRLLLYYAVAYTAALAALAAVACGSHVMPVVD